MADYTPDMPRKPPRPIWGQNVKRILVEKGTSAKKVADKCGMGEQQFSNVTNDPHSNPTVETLTKIADALGVHLADLFRSPEATEGPHEDSRRAISTSTTILEHLSPALRIAFVQLLTDILAGLGRQAESLSERSAGAGPAATTGRTLPSGHR